MSVQGPIEESRRYISGAANPGVYMGRMKLPSLDSTSRRAEIDHHGAVVVGDEDVGRLDVQVQHLVLVHDAQAAQDLVEQRADGRLAEHFCFLSSRAVMMKSCRVAPSR
jgi:hypothetical protein